MQIDCFDDVMCKRSIGTSVATLRCARRGRARTQRSAPCQQSQSPPTRRAIISSITKKRYFEDVKAKPGEKALVTFHTVAFEGSIGFVNMLQATRLMRKGFETSILLYGPGVTLGVQRGFPETRRRGLSRPSELQQQIAKFMAEGGKVYACRFALQALYGHGEPSLIPGITPISPLDVLDSILLHRRDNAFILDTWTL